MKEISYREAVELLFKGETIKVIYNVNIDPTTLIIHLTDKDELVNQYHETILLSWLNREDKYYKLGDEIEFIRLEYYRPGYETTNTIDLNKEDIKRITATLNIDLLALIETLESEN